MRKLALLAVGVALFLATAAGLREVGRASAGVICGDRTDVLASRTVPTPAPTAVPTAAPATAPTPTASPLRVPGRAIQQSTSLQEAVTSYLSGKEGVYGVVVKNLATGETAAVNADQVFPTASVYKLWIMTEVFRQVAAGTLSLDQQIVIDKEDAWDVEPYGGLEPGDTVTVRVALEKLITISSNAAAGRLMRLAGGPNVYRTMAALQRETGGTPTASLSWVRPREMAVLLERLVAGKVVSKDASRQMIDLLLSQRVDDRIPALLPDNVSVANKTGNLPGIVNDVGIVFGPKATYVICFFSSQVDEEEATNTITGLSRLVYDRFNGS